jgi:hypothetical protein
MTEIPDLTHNGQGQVTVTVNENDELVMPEVNNPPTYLEVTDTYRDKVKIGHRFGDREMGFDLTMFESRQEFVWILEAMGLDPYYDYARVNASTGSSEDYYYYVWGNENGMILLGNNPITGEYRDGNFKEYAYGSYIGIEGDKEFIDEASYLIEKYSNYKDIDRQRRSFI